MNTVSSRKLRVFIDTHFVRDPGGGQRLMQRNLKRILSKAPALIFAGIFALLSGLWIAASDRLLLAMLVDPARITALHTAKEFAFVLAISLFIYVIVRRWDLDRRESEASLTTLAETVSLETGERCLALITAQLNNLLDADITYIARIDTTPGLVDAFAVHTRGREAPDFSFPIAGTAIESILAGGPARITDAAQELFPRDGQLAEMDVSGVATVLLRDSSGHRMGLLVALKRGPMHVERKLDAHLRILAMRAAAALEQVRHEEAIAETLRTESAVSALLHHALGVDSIEVAFSHALQELLTTPDLTSAVGAAIYLNDTKRDGAVLHSEFWRAGESGRAPEYLPSGLCPLGETLDGDQLHFCTAPMPADGRIAHGHIQVRLPGPNHPVGWLLLLMPRGATCGAQDEKFLVVVARILSTLYMRHEALEANRELAIFPRENPSPIAACDQDGLVQFRNPAFQQLKAMVGVADDHDLFPSDHRTLVERCIAENRHINDCEVALGERVYAWEYHPVGHRAYLYANDITRHKRLEERLRHAALHDNSTGLPNRVCFVDELSEVLSSIKQDPALSYSVLFIKLDRLTHVNDVFGPLFGDLLLMEFANRLREVSVDRSIVVARIGGAEFAMLSQGSTDDARTCAEKLIEILQRSYLLNGIEVNAHTCIGIVSVTAEYVDTLDLMRDAYAAMHRARERGAGHYEVFEPRLHQQVEETLRLETELRAELAADRLEVYYQPIIALPEQLVVGFEALSRWNHPSLGFISPMRFIPLAEQAGLIGELGRNVLRRACKQIAEWRAADPERADLYVSVNLSSRQFMQPNLVEMVIEIIEAHGLDPSALHLEVTESVLLDDRERAGQVLHRFREHGIRIYLDDFGTGYSSLSYLHNLPFDTLKIDRSFIMDLTPENGKTGIVPTIISLARNFKMSVVAEGIETKEQLEALNALGCDRGQGFYFAKPMPANEINQLLGTSLYLH